jgi:PAS domain S-box-containing protein
MPKQVRPSGTDPPSSGFESLDPKALQVFEATPQEMFIWDPSGNLLFANQRALDFLGFSLDRIRTMDFRSELYHPDDLPTVKEAIKKAVTRGEPLEVKARILRHDGRYIWFIVRANPVRDENGRILQWYGALTDVDDEVRAEDLLRLTIDTTPAMVHTGKPDWGLDYFNQRWMEYLGVASKEMLGWRWTSVIHPDEVAAFVDKWRVSVRTGEPFQAESRVRRADGSYRWMIHRKVPLRDEQGNIIKWYGSSMDIDDLKHAEEDLRRSEAFLEEGQRISHTGS